MLKNIKGVSQRQTDNTMAKNKKTKWQCKRSLHKKTKDRATQTPLKPE